MPDQARVVVTNTTPLIALTSATGKYSRNINIEEVCMNTQTYNVQEARTHLSQLLKDVASGADVIIARAGKPMVRMSRIEAGGSKICFGILKGKAKVSEDFDAPLPDDLLSEFEANRCGS